MNIYNPRPPQLTEKEMMTVRKTTSKVLRLLVANSWYQEGMNKYPYFLAPILENNILIGIGFEIFNDFRTYGQSDDKTIVIFVEADVIGSCKGSTIAGKFQWARGTSNKPFDGRIILEFSNWELFSFQQLARHNNKFLADFSVNDLKEYLAKIKYRENRPCDFSFLDELDNDDLENYFILPARENAVDETPTKVRRRLWERLFIIIYHELVHAKQFDNKNKGYISPEEGRDRYVSQFVEIQPRLGQIIQELIFKRRPKFFQRKMSLGEYLLKYSDTFQRDSKYMSADALHYILQGTYQWLKENNLVLLQNPKKEIEFAEGFDKSMTSEGLRKHVEEGLGIPDSFFRLGSKAYLKMFKEIEAYWDENNVILRGPSKWMIENLEVGTPAIYEGERVFLDVPFRGGSKKFVVYHNSGRKNKNGEIVAKKIEWGDPNLTVKNDQYSRSKSFWNRQGCDGYYKKSGKKTRRLDPSTAGFWACYGPTLFASQLELQSDMPW